MATREQFIEAIGNVDAAMRFETSVLSIGDELLPQEARDVRDKKSEPSAVYWDWLLSQITVQP